MNDLSPAYTRIRYHVGSHRHVMTFACNPDGIPVAGLIPDVVPRVGSPVAWDTAVFDFIDLLAPMYSETAAFDLAEFWYKPTPTSPTTFIYAISLGVAGTNGTPPLVAGEEVLTFRTPSVGGFKLYLLENVTVENRKLAAPYTGQPYLAPLNAFICSDDDWIIARNNDYPLIGLTATSKVNDVLRDKYLIGG